MYTLKNAELKVIFVRGLCGRVIKELRAMRIGRPL
jgi:hypothetical protein